MQIPSHQSEMIRDSRVLQKAQQEVRRVYIDDGQSHFDKAKLDRLKYLDMVIAESLRLHPPVPLLAPGENRDKKVKLNSYDVPVNTKVIVNAWMINRDPRYWTEAERFFPERFMDCSTDYKGTDFHFIPFWCWKKDMSWNFFWNGDRETYCYKRAATDREIAGIDKAGIRKRESKTRHTIYVVH